MRCRCQMQSTAELPRTKNLPVPKAMQRAIGVVCNSLNGATHDVAGCGIDIYLVCIGLVAVCISTIFAIKFQLARARGTHCDATVSVGEDALVGYT
jgi:hypothetical protein